MGNQRDHNQAIIEQFTKQAVPFLQMPAHSGEEALRLYLEASGAGSEDTVLDVACGPGIVTCAFAPHVRHVTGLDLTPAMIEQAEKLAREKGIGNASFEVGDALPLPYPDGSFSLVISRFSFHHLLDPLAALQEMVRVCMERGTVMVIDVALPPEKINAYNRMEALRDPSHTSALSIPRFGEIAAAAGLQEVCTVWHKLEMEMEAQIAASFPQAGDADKIRELLRGDVGRDEIGVGARRTGEKIHFAYPVLVMVGRKKS